MGSKRVNGVRARNERQLFQGGDLMNDIFRREFTSCCRRHVHQELVDTDRAASVWGRYSKLLYPRGQSAVLDGEGLSVGRNIVRLGGKRYFLQVCIYVYVNLCMRAFEDPHVICVL